MCGALSAQPDHRVRAAVRQARAGYPPADEIVTVDLLSSPPARLQEICEGLDVVVHLAAPNEVACAAEPERALVDTIVATRRMATAAAAAGVRRFVYVSTFHVYGLAAAPGVVLTEETSPEPRSTYAIGHLAAEYVAAAVAADGSDVVRLRVTNMIGAPAHPSVQRWSLLANDLCRRAALGQALVVRNSDAWRDFITQADTCRMIASALDPGHVPPGTYNVASGSLLTVLQLAEIVRDVATELTGDRPELTAPDPLQEPEQPCRVSTDRLERLGIRATASIRSAIEETMRFCLTNRDALV